MISQAANPSLAAAIVAFCGITGGILVGQFAVTFHKLKQKWLMDKTLTSKIATAPQGLAEIKGQICPDKTQELNAPLSGRPCYWFYYKVEKSHEYRDIKGLRLNGECKK